MDRVGASVGRFRVLRHFSGTAACLACAIALGGCFLADQAKTEPPEGLPATSPTIERDADVQYYPSDEPLRLALEHFNRGEYGVAQKYFRDAVERAPKDASAWIGLAASYDHLGRFDLADQAYSAAVRLVGETTVLLNNRGYSYLLRGNLTAARADFLKAYAREPNNPIIRNNLRLLDGSKRFIVRSPDTEPPDVN